MNDLWKLLASGLVIVALLTLTIGIFIHRGGGGCTSTSTTPSKIDAWVMAQQFVKDRLKSPGSADFGNQYADDAVTDLGGGKFRVLGYVDAQNAFGAKIRTWFICELEYVRNGHWRLTRLEFIDSSL